MSVHKQFNINIINPILLLTLSISKLSISSYHFLFYLFDSILNTIINITRFKRSILISLSISPRVDLSEFENSFAFRNTTDLYLEGLLNVVVLAS